MRDKQERSRAMPVLPEHVDQAVAQDPGACTMACAARAIGLDSVKLSYDIIAGNVMASWERLDVDPKTGEERPRVFHAVVEPLKEAVQILTATDLDKKRLARTMPAEGWMLRLTDVQSRWKQRGHESKPGYKKPRTGDTPRRKPRRTSSRMYAAE